MNLLTLPIPAAIAGQIGPQIKLNGAPRNLTLQANFVPGSGGTTVDCWVQTSLDNGATWADIANFHFTTSAAKGIYNLSAATPKTTQVVPTDGSLANNTAVDGILGPIYRTKTTVVGTYVGASLSVDVASDQIQ
jgi:hypothetical protein